MTSRILKQLRQNPAFQKQPEPPAPAALDTSQLNVALGELIQQAARAGAEAAVEKQKPYQNPAVPAHRRPFTDKAESHEFPPPPPMAKPVRDLTVHLTRNEVGRVNKVSIGNVNFTVQRDGEGRVVRMVPQED